MWNKLSKTLARESSEIDWCESNYQITTCVAEFFNTVSNVFFFIFPPLLIYLFRQYAAQVTWGVNIVWLLLITVGIASAYFHATLSLVGQLLDEIAIIWVIMAVLALWFPRRLLPMFLAKDRGLFSVTVIVCTAISTGLACIMPEINAFVLICLGIPASVLLVTELKRTKCERVKQLGMRSIVIWCFAITSWISDKFFCYYWTQLKFPYMHCLWHLFIALSSYQICVLFAYFDAMAEVPMQQPQLSYWPHNHWTFFGIPFVSLEKAQPPLNAQKIL